MNNHLLIVLFYGRKRREQWKHIFPQQIKGNAHSQYINRLMIGHININSFWNKFEMLWNSIKDNLDILLLSEPKLDSKLPSNQFSIEGYAAPLRFDRNSRRGRILLYIREDIQTWLPATCLAKHFKGFFVELNLH